MDLKIIDKKEDKLLNREEIYAIAEHPGEATPKREEVRKKLSAMLGVNENLLVVKKIISSYRMPRSRIWVVVYKDEETLRRLEPKYILKRNGLAE